MRKIYLIYLMVCVSLLVKAQNLTPNQMTAGERGAGSDAIINFDNTTIPIQEDEGMIEVPVTISQTATLSVDVSVVFTNDLTGAFDTTTATVNFSNGGATTVAASFNFSDNNDPNQDYYVNVELTNNTDGQIGDDNQATIYVIDDETHAPEAANILDMELLVSYDGVAEAEIVTYDAGSQRLFVSNSSDNGVEIVDFNDPENPSSIGLISMAAFGEEVTSVAAFDGVVAIAVAGEDQANGRIVLIDNDGIILSDIEAGALPDMVTFTPDGSQVLFANEGEPSEDYLTDPEGSVGIIDVSVGATNVTQDLSLIHI